jgi:sodium transport system permease protein
VSSIATGVDTSAGERERNVLEILLIQPVQSLSIISAKLMGIILVAMLGVTLTLTFSALAMSQVELEKVGLSFNLSPFNFIAILLAMIPLAALGASMHLLVGYFSKTFKEAQSQVSMVIMVPALAPLILMFTPDPPDILRQLPVTGQFLYLEQIFKAERIDPIGPLLASAATLAIAALFVWLTSRQLGSERSINAL